MPAIRGQFLPAMLGNRMPLGDLLKKKTWLDNSLNFPSLPCWIPMVDLKCFQGCMTYESSGYIC